MESSDRFEQLYARYKPRLIVFCRNLTGVSSGEGEDLAQEVFEKAFLAFHRYDANRSFSTWLFTIARNHCADRGRRRTRQESSGFSEHSDENIQSYGSDSGARSVHHPPEEHLERNELEEFVRGYLNSLGENDRTIAFLHWFEGKRYREISAILGTPLGTIKFRVSRIKRGLKNAMEDSYA